MDTIDELTKQISTLNGVNLLGLVLVGFSYILKQWEIIPNRVAGIIIVATGAGLGPLFSVPDSEMSFAVGNPQAVKIAHGFLVGCVAWILGGYVVDFILSKFPNYKQPNSKP